MGEKVLGTQIKSTHVLYLNLILIPVFFILLIPAQI